MLHRNAARGKILAGLSHAFDLIPFLSVNGAAPFLPLSPGTISAEPILPTGGAKMVERSRTLRRVTRRMSPWDDIAGIFDDDPDGDAYLRRQLPIAGSRYLSRIAPSPRGAR